jgi:hypothetical protein
VIVRADRCLLECPLLVSEAIVASPTRCWRTASRAMLVAPVGPDALTSLHRLADAWECYWQPIRLSSIARSSNQATNGLKMVPSCWYQVAPTTIDV